MDAPSFYTIRQRSIHISPHTCAFEPEFILNTHQIACPLNQVVNLTWQVKNTRTEPVSLFIRIQPRINADQNLESVLVWMGSLEQVVHIDAEAQVHIVLPIIQIAHGVVEFWLQAEEIGVSSNETIIQKSKYEPPIVIMGSLDKSHWTMKPLQTIARPA